MQHGLAPTEAAQRLQQDGPNALRQSKTVSPLALLAGQFGSLVIWVLIGAALVAAALGEVVDGIAILTIVILNAVLGFFQEYRAERAVAALARLTAPRARVVRGGHAAVIAAAEVVRGDILLLDAGDLVAADACLVDAAILHTNEAPLTGESQPVEKQAGLCAPETPLAERYNMVFLGTSITRGSGRAVVVATGMDTEVGHIAMLLETASSDVTPLQRRLDQVARGICAIDTVRSFNPLEDRSPFRQGVRQQYGVSASGGSEATTFYLSGDFERETDHAERRAQHARAQRSQRGNGSGARLQGERRKESGQHDAVELSDQRAEQ